MKPTLSSGRMRQTCAASLVFGSSTHPARPSYMDTGQGPGNRHGASDPPGRRQPPPNSQPPSLWRLVEGHHLETGHRRRHRLPCATGTFQKPAGNGRLKRLILRRRNRPVLPFQNQVILGRHQRQINLACLSRKASLFPTIRMGV